MNPQTASILEVLRDLPEQSLTATLRNPRGSSTRTFKGALLYDYAQAAGLKPRAPSLGFGNYYFVATAEDGFTISLAYFEVTPRASSKQVILAYEQDGEVIRAGVRLVVPGDDLGGRSIFGVSNIELRSVPSIEPQPTRARSETIELKGLLERPQSLSLQDLSRFPAHEVATQATPRHGGRIMPSRAYGGVLLWDVLEAAGPVIDPAVNEDIMRKIVVARSTDGYAAVIAPGEVDSRFMNGQVVIATECEGKPLADGEGDFRLVVPYDNAVGRALKSLASIELLPA